MDEKYVPLSAAIKAIHERFDEALVWDESGEETADVIEDVLLDLKPADVRPVVLCRNCKHPSRNYKDGPLRCPKTPTELDEDGFGICAPVPDDFWCKYGEPKDSGADMRLEPPEREVLTGEQ